MANTKIQNKAQNNDNANNAQAGKGTTEVLYQKMGNRWFAFSVIDDEVFVGSIAPEDIERIEADEARANGQAGAKTFKITGNS